MNRGAITTIKELKAGDRFYKLGDKLKTSFQILGSLSGNKIEVCEVKYLQSGRPPLHRLRAMAASISAVYLRNINDSN